MEKRAPMWYRHVVSAAHMGQGDGVDIHLDEEGNPRIIPRSFVVGEEFAGKRLDLFLVNKMPRLSRTRLQKIIRSQLTRASGRPLRPNSKVELGEEITMLVPARPEPDCPRHFGVLYEDEQLMVVNKPAGLPVHASAKFYYNTLTRVLLETYGEPPPQICHRLDMETSGCLLVAFPKAVAAQLKAAFESRLTKKTYLALVHGDPPWDEAESIDLPLGLVNPDQPITIRMTVRDDAPPACTEVRVLSRPEPGYALVECKPITGRQHQIRAHLAAVAFPIVGDKLYGHGDEPFREFCDTGMSPTLLRQFEMPRHALHAAAITFPHPSKGTMTVECPLAADIQAFIDNGCIRPAGTEDDWLEDLLED